MLRILIRLVALLVRLLFYPVSLFRRSRAALPSGWIALDLKGSVEDIPAPRRFWERPRRPPLSLHALDDRATTLAPAPRARARRHDPGRALRDGHGDVAPQDPGAH